MTRAEEAALKRFPNFTAENMDDVMFARYHFRQGYEQAEKDTIERAIDWLKDYVKYFEIYDEKGVEEFRKAMEEKK